MFLNRILFLINVLCMASIKLLSLFYISDHKHSKKKKIFFLKQLNNFCHFILYMTSLLCITKRKGSTPGHLSLGSICPLNCSPSLTTYDLPPQPLHYSNLQGHSPSLMSLWGLSSVKQSRSFRLTWCHATHFTHPGLLKLPRLTWCHATHFTHPGLLEVAQTDSMSRYTHFTHPGLLEAAQTDSMSRYTHFTHPGLLEATHSDLTSSYTHFTHPGLLEAAQTDSMSRYTHFTHPGLLEATHSDLTSSYTHFTHPGLLEVAQAEVQSCHIVENLWRNISLHLLLQDASSCAIGWQRPLDEHVEQMLSQLNSESENVTLFFCDPVILKMGHSRWVSK